MFLEKITLLLGIVKFLPEIVKITLTPKDLRFHELRRLTDINE